MQRLRARAAQLDDEARNIVAGDTSDDIGELAAGIEAETAALKAAELDMEHCLAELGASREDLVIREQVLEEARSDVQHLRHELASLEAVQRAALGRTEGAADDWLRTQKLTDAPRVGEGLSVRRGWERAVETRARRSPAGSTRRLDRRLRAASTSLEHGLVTLFEGGRAVDTAQRLLPLLCELRQIVACRSDRCSAACTRRSRLSVALDQRAEARGAAKASSRATACGSAPTGCGSIAAKTSGTGSSNAASNSTCCANGSSRRN